MQFHTEGTRWDYTSESLFEGWSSYLHDFLFCLERASNYHLSICTQERNWICNNNDNDDDDNNNSNDNNNNNNNNNKKIIIIIRAAEQTV